MIEPIVVKYKAPIDEHQLALAKASTERNEALTPRVIGLADKLIEDFVKGEHQQSVEDMFEEIFTSGNYYLYDMIDFVRHITIGMCFISNKIYPWFDDILEQVRPHLEAAKKYKNNGLT